LGNSAPVVGDVDGDGKPDIAVTTQVAGSGENGFVRLYDAVGVPNPMFPIALPIGGGAVPAIADIDQDGRNELIVSGSAWRGATGLYDKVWAFDMQGAGPYGRVEWGQFGGGPAHRNFYYRPPYMNPLPPCQQP
jgi:hypothetical protein